MCAHDDDHGASCPQRTPVAVSVTLNERAVISIKVGSRLIISLPAWVKPAQMSFINLRHVAVFKCLRVMARNHKSEVEHGVLAPNGGRAPKDFRRLTFLPPLI